MDDAPRAWHGRPLDVALMLAMAGFVAGWLSFDLPHALGVELRAAELYADHIDPFFRHQPIHIEMTIAVAAFVYGPAYVAILVGLWRRAAWTGKLALPISGLLIGTNTIYMVASLTSARPPLNLPVFLALNGAYTVVPLLLLVRFCRDAR